MRLSRLGLACYGHFETQALALDTRPGCINLVVAPNGAGKSVLRQAIAEMLFGIHPQTPMGFAFSYAKMRLLAEVEAGAGAFGFIRRKGEGNTVTDLRGQPADAALLGRLPRKDDRKRLERLFMLDSAQLRAGGRALMQTDGDLADALLSGTGELGSARALAAQLAEQRDEAAPKRRKATAPFHRACDQWTDAGRQLMGDAVIRPAHIAEREAERQTAIDTRAAANAAASAAAAGLARLGRIRRTRPLLKALEAAEQWLAAHPDAPILPVAAGPALTGAEAGAAEAGRRHADLNAQHAALVQELAALGAPDPVLAQAAAIEALTRESGRAEQSRVDLPKRRTELTDSHGRLAALLRQLGHPGDPASAEQAIRPAPEIAAARELIQAASQIEADAEAVARIVTEARQRIAEAEDGQDTTPPKQMERLKAVLATATGGGDPARQAEDAASAVAAARIAQDGALARVPHWRDGAPALLALAVPSEAELTRLDEARRAAATDLGQAQRAEADAAAAIDGLRQRLAVVTSGGALPDATAVATARAHRDRGWRLVEARLAGQPGAEAEYDGGAPLPLAYARAVAAADAIADRRAEETERLAAAANLAVEIEQAGQARDAAAARLAAAQQAEARASGDWSGCTARLGLAAGAALAELRSFLQAREAVIAAAAAAGSAASDQARLEAQHAGWAAALAEAAGLAPGPLPVLIAAASSQVTAAARAELQREAQAKALRTERRRLATAEQALGDARAKQAAWATRWQAALAALGRPADERPAATSAVLDALVALAAESASARQIEARLAEMSDQLALFARDARRIADLLDEPGDDPATLAQALADRLKRAQAQAAKRDALQAQADAARKRLHGAATESAGSQAALAAAIEAAGAADLVTAKQRVAYAAERAQHAEARAKALERLMEDGDGLTLAELHAEAASLPPDDLAEQARLLEATAQDRQAAAQDAAAAAERIDTELRLLSTRHDAAQAALDRQAAAARIGRVLEEALVQHAATTLLDHALRLVEAESGTNAKLARIGGTFAALTGGAYERVSPADDDPQSKEHGRLQAHERDGAAKHIAQLSEGTRDQLYLALRIVAIEDHAAAAAPLPFIADDILQTFDDSRALAALHALLALSAHTQVIVLTHHPHLADLARGLPPGSVHLAAL